MADSGILDVDKDLVGARLRNGDLLELEFTTSLLDDLSPLLLGDFACHCRVLGVVWEE